MDSRLARELISAYQPVVLLFSNEKPEGAAQFKEGTWGCVVGLLTAAAKGKIAVLDRKTTGCGGGMIGMGFTTKFAEFPGGIEHFLSCGAGEGFPEGEGYKKTPELAHQFIESLPVVDIPFSYIILKPLSAVDPEKETPQSVIFYANPDQLTALVVLASYDRPGYDHTIIPQAAGCQGIGILPYLEAEREYPRAVVGMMDVSARPCVPADVVTFTVPYKRFLELEANVQGSFFERPAWQKVKARLEKKD
ncbi:MAG: DUF169 domain-containing protein [Armatimonadota bacterium]